jgi:HK97 family phage major capsid protein
MKSIQQLRDQIAEHHRRANALLAEKGSRKWSSQDQQAFDGHMDTVERLSREVNAWQTEANESAAKSFKDAQRLSASDKKTRKAGDWVQGFDLWMRKAPGEWSYEDQVRVANTMSTTTGSEGGYTMAPMVATTLVDSLKDCGSMRRASGYLVTETGSPMSFPYSDGSSEIGELVANNAGATGSDPTFSTAALDAWKFGSKIITVPIELLQDSAIDVQAILFKRARDRIARIQNLKFTTGSGTGEPYGLITGSRVAVTGSLGNSSYSAITYDLLVTLVDCLDITYLQEAQLDLSVPGKGPGWMFNQSVRKYLRKVKDTSGRPIWMPSYDKGITQGSGDMLLGYPVYLNNDMPSPAANAISVAFGNFSKYMVRDALDVTMFRFDDTPFISKGQVGFLAWARAGGNLLDAGSVVTYQHSAT